MADKPRILNNGKDMLMSLLVLLILVVFVVITSRNCSIGLTGGAADDKIPPFEVSSALRADASTMPFPIRQPALPAGWKPNSGTSGQIGGKQVSTVGWITPGGYYLGLSQSDATESELLPTLNPNADKDGPLAGTGSREVGTTKWVTYVAGDRLAPSDGMRKVWVADLGDVRIALSGKAGEAEFTTLAQAVVSAAPLPSGRR
ncbi:MAG TPA: DUF4245 domain-containing protein [Gordonia sp. (in: high G+C Gram-positive bacteria)]|uniref:DUF4245 domain-containing protein n=1 Tax=unclassified Gordonia (in: high G+C Gram-positive bacteria) TaxID=2657482 RepID=UPI000F9D88F4|nr:MULTISPECIES: DUF4245 domain-containing protein [unclassified Gordonia (in: high G+C Gram-positive bacteria)]RUP40952.1 MAG: DUF4245 domain-containing protein [Gordonia sp. (in: high G+C Gram-positive bacteria)]HNP59061.1 DUF4245 domain-containing protein [Gordonia sp. (in: high G+C Gram-positive bacteria)]HRC52801.1 DUF4245 domain-containing protein [Gordonia sp. (in: high G+C Gram-positive bacteria)]